MAFAQARERLQVAIFGDVGSDRGLGEDALWDGVPVRVRLSDGEEGGRFGDGATLILPSRSLRVRRIDVAEPRIGHQIVLTASQRRFEVIGDPVLDRNAVWTCPVAEMQQQAPPHP